LEVVFEKNVSGFGFAKDWFEATNNDIDLKQLSVVAWSHKGIFYEILC